MGEAKARVPLATAAESPNGRSSPFSLLTLVKTNLGLIRMSTSKQEANCRDYLRRILDCYQSAARIETNDDYAMFRDSMLEMLLCITADYHEGQLDNEQFEDLTYRVVKLQENTYKQF